VASWPRGLHPFGHRPTSDRPAFVIEQSPTDTIIRVRGELDFVVAEQVASAVISARKWGPDQSLHVDTSGVGRRRASGAQLVDA